MGWFESQSEKEKKSAVTNLIAIMLADGRIDPNEMDFLASVCRRVGISEKELKTVINKPGSVKFTPAENRSERASQLLDMVFMMLADGQIDQRELDLCITIGTQMGFRPSAVQEVVQELIRQIRQGARETRVSVDVNTLLR